MVCEQKKQQGAAPSMPTSIDFLHLRFSSSEKPTSNLSAILRAHWLPLGCVPSCQAQGRSPPRFATLQAPSPLTAYAQPTCRTSNTHSALTPPCSHRITPFDRDVQGVSERTNFYCFFVFRQNPHLERVLELPSPSTPSRRLSKSPVLRGGSVQRVYYIDILDILDMRPWWQCVCAFVVVLGQTWPAPACGMSDGACAEEARQRISEWRHTLQHRQEPSEQHRSDGIAAWRLRHVARKV